MDRNKNRRILCPLTILGCLVMAWVEIVWLPSYGVKSIIKMLLFLGIGAFFVKITGENPFLRLFRLEKRELWRCVLLGIVVYGFILGTYFLFGKYFDFSGVTISLKKNLKITKETFLWVAMYISLVNSLLEEFFFRGFAFLTLRRSETKRFAYVFSSGIFALYHISMMVGWFSPLLLALLILGLFAGGIFFNWLDEKSGTIYPSWMVHLWANLGINTVGMILFYGR